MYFNGGFSKFTSIKNILSEVVTLGYNQGCNQTLSFQFSSCVYVYLTIQ